MKFTFKIVANAAERLAVMEQCQTHVNQTGGLMVSPHDMEGALLSTGTGNVTARVCQDKGHTFSPADAKVQAEIDRLLNEASQQMELEQALNLYKRSSAWRWRICGSMCQRCCG